MRISKSNQFNRTDNTSAGFTLIELLVSISIMGVVSALVGTGITFMVSSNQKLAAAQSRRVEVSQALEVISYDIRRAGNVNGTQNTTPATTIAAAITASVNSTEVGAGSLGSTWDSSYTPVLFLNISIVCSDSIIRSEQVIYSTKANGSGDGRGLNSLYRYGQIADENDSILCSGNVPVKGPINARIADNFVTPRTPPTCLPPTATPSAIGSGADGFYTCVGDGQVSIALFAKLSGSLIYGDNRTITSGSMASIAQDTLVPNGTTNDCTVPNLSTTNPNLALSSTNSSAGAVNTAGLSSSGIRITTDGSTVISQTPLEGSLIPCNTGLVTYTY